MNKKTTLFIACLSALNTSYANKANDNLLDLSFEELTQVKVIIASGISQDIKKASATVSLITKDDIKKTGATNLVDILENIPGVHIQYDSFGFRPLVHIRGGNSHQTLLMVNGNPLKDLLWAFGMFWKGLTVHMIERIEVIRGPGSALYGADASSGVINIITKTSEQSITNTIGIRASSLNDKTAWLETATSIQGYQLGLTASFSSINGHSPYISSDRSGSSSHINTGVDNADVQFSLSKGTWQLLGNYKRHDNIQTAMTGAGYFDPITEAKDERYDIDLLYKKKINNTAIDAKLHYQDLNYSSGDGFRESPPSTSFPDGQINRMSSSERQFSAALNGLYTGIDDHKFLLGAGYIWQDVYKVQQLVNYQDINGNTLSSAGPLIDISSTVFTFTPKNTRQIKYAILQDVWSFAKNWELTLGFRFDHYSDFGKTTNPRLALIWETTPKLTSKVLYGQAFRAPSFQELYASTSRAKGNANLKAEESETLEVGFNYAMTTNFDLGLSIYSIKNTNSIARDSNRQYQNTGEYNSNGFELETSWKANKNINLLANYSRRYPENNSFRTFKEPEEEAYLRFDWQFKSNWHWNIQTNWVSTRIRKDNDIRPNIDNYMLTDTTLRYTPSSDIELAVSVRNLFDEDAREPTGTSISNDLPLAERSLYAEIKYNFGSK